MGHFEPQKSGRGRQRFSATIDWMRDNLAGKVVMALLRRRYLVFGSVLALFVFFYRHACIWSHQNTGSPRSVRKRPGALAELLGQRQPVPVAPLRVAVGIPADLLRRRPDLRRAERELAAQCARVGVAMADLTCLRVRASR